MESSVVDVSDFLDQPLVAHVAATGSNGPTVRPVWFLFEHNTLWWLTGSYSRLTDWLADDPRVAVVIDNFDANTGTVLAVTMAGNAETRPLDLNLTKRKIAKYLGHDVGRWPDRFRDVLDDADANWLVALKPTTQPRLRDLSYDLQTHGGA